MKTFGLLVPAGKGSAFEKNVGSGMRAGVRLAAIGAITATSRKATSILLIEEPL
jgi:hypothetical protein